MDQIEGHPIPQDVTGFQFRLVGDMTVKQFAYLASGIVLGWISFSIIPSFFLVKLLIGGTFASIGAILAFIPIDGRPADTMILLFIKTLTRPTQYTYKKLDSSAAMTTISQTSPAAPVVPLTTSDPTVTLTNNPQPQFEPNEPLIQKSDAPVAQTPQDNEEIKREEATTQAVIQQAQETIAAVKQEKAHTSDPAIHEKVLALEQQLQEALAQKHALEDRLVNLERHAIAPAPTAARTVKNVPQPLQAGGIPLTPDVPNLVSGVVRDSRGNVLPQILVEVKDRDNNPVRAFKTNALGQFTSATPLLNGTYTVSLEDPKKQQRFDNIELSVKGDILTPLEITSTDAREDLRKELFGKT